MKKLFLFIGVIILCFLFACKKDNPPSPPPPPPPIDSFLLHPPPVLDSLPIPLTIGTWWKYQRIDSSFSDPCYFNCGTSHDSSTELISVIGKTPIVDSAVDTHSPLRTRYDTVESFLLEVKNLTKGTLDTVHAYYYNASFFIKPHKDAFNMFIYLPILEGKIVAKVDPSATWDSTSVIKNLSVNVLNQNFDNCIYYNYNNYYFAGSYAEQYYLKMYLKPGIGFVDWEYFDYWVSHYGNNTYGFYNRKLIDYYIAP